MEEDKTLTYNKILKWQTILLFENSAYSVKSILPSDKIENVIKMKDAENKANKQNINKVISFDIIRTRVKELKPTLFNDNLKTLLYSFIQNEKIEYMQGLNEIFGCFLLMEEYFPKTQSNNHIVFSLYNLCSSFIMKYIINFYNDIDLMTLKTSFVLITVLLKYHDPKLNNKLSDHNISPELFCTSWLLTVFASKMMFTEIFYLWDFIINFNDPSIFFFIIVAILIYHRSFLIQSDQNSILQFFTQLTINDIQLKCILTVTLVLYSQTPQSFFMYIKKIKLFNPQFKKHKEIFELADLSNLNMMPILTSEILKYCFDKQIKCLDSHCVKFLVGSKKKKIDNTTTNSLSLCDFCSNNITSKVDAIGLIKKDFDKSIDYIFTIANDTHNEVLGYYFDTKKKNYIYDSLLANLNNPLLNNVILLDIKNVEEASITLPESIAFNFTHYFNYKDLVKKFLKYKDSHHFIIITDNVNELNKYSNIHRLRKYVSNLSSQTFDNIISTESSKNFNCNESNYEFEVKPVRAYKKSMSDKNVDLMLSKEELSYIRFNNLINEFYDNDFKHISFAYKGFIDLHKYCIKFNLKLINHNNSSCIYCLESSKTDIILDSKSKDKRKNSGFFTIITDFLLNVTNKSNETKVINGITDFPSTDNLAKNEIIFEALTINTIMFRLEKISFYFLNNEMSIFLKVAKNSFEPIELNISLKMVTKKKKLPQGNIKSDFIVQDNKLIYNNNRIKTKNELEIKEDDCSLFINNWISSDVNVDNFIYPYILRFFSVGNNNTMELLFYFDKNENRKIFEDCLSSNYFK